MTETFDPDEVLAEVRRLNSKAQNQARQLAGRGMIPDPGQMAMQRVNMLATALLGRVNIDSDEVGDDEGSTLDRLVFELRWFEHLTSLNDKALLSAPPNNNGPNGPGGLHLP